MAAEDFEEEGEDEEAEAEALARPQTKRKRAASAAAAAALEDQTLIGSPSTRSSHSPLRVGRRGLAGVWGLVVLGDALLSV